MSDPIRRYRVIAISHDQCVNPHGVQAIEDQAGVLCYVSDAETAIAKAKAERDAMAVRAGNADRHEADSRHWGDQWLTMQAERDAALARYADTLREVEQLKDSLAKERAARKRSEDALSNYGAHFQDCPARFQDTAECRCGYERALTPPTSTTPGAKETK